MWIIPPTHTNNSIADGSHQQCCQSVNDLIRRNVRLGFHEEALKRLKGVHLAERSISSNTIHITLHFNKNPVMVRASDGYSDRPEERIKWVYLMDFLSEAILLSQAAFSNGRKPSLQHHISLWLSVQCIRRRRHRASRGLPQTTQFVIESKWTAHIEHKWLGTFDHLLPGQIRVLINTLKAARLSEPVSTDLMLSILYTIGM